MVTKADFELDKIKKVTSEKNDVEVTDFKAILKKKFGDGKHVIKRGSKEEIKDVLGNTKIGTEVTIVIKDTPQATLDDSSE